MLAKAIMTATGGRPVKVYYSFSQQDKFWVDKLDQSLAKFGWDASVSQWSDNHLPPSDSENEDYHETLFAADVILLFLSSNYLNSDYLCTLEMKLALTRHESGSAWVFPVFIETVDAAWIKSRLTELGTPLLHEAPLQSEAKSDETLEQILHTLLKTLAEQGLKNATHQNWRLHMTGHLADFTDQDCQKIISRLQRLAMDEGIEVLERSEGSVVLLIHSTPLAFKRIYKHFRDSRLSLELGREVLKIQDDLQRLFSTSADSKEHAFSTFQQLGNAEMFLPPSEAYKPHLLNGLIVRREHPLQVDFQFKKGDASPEILHDGTDQIRLMEYFYTAIALKEDDLWINLGPGEVNRTTSEALSRTRMGRDLLAMDLDLKRFTAYLLHPDSESGRNYWQELQRRAFDRFGSTDIPYRTYQRVWLIPETATVFEGPITEQEEEQWKDGEYPKRIWVDESKLKVEWKSELGERRIKIDNESQRIKDLSTEVFQELIVPLIEKEVNEGKTFAVMRQAYTCMIMAMWFRKNFAQHSTISQYIDSGKASELTTLFNQRTEPAPDDQIGGDQSGLIPFQAWDTQYYANECKRIYDDYMNIFQDGVAYLIRDEFDPYSHLKVTRSYFSGALDWRAIALIFRCLK